MNNDKLETIGTISMSAAIVLVAASILGMVRSCNASAVVCEHCGGLNRRVLIDHIPPCKSCEGRKTSEVESD